MNKNPSSFGRQLAVIALPVGLQSMLQSSFSIVDQMMAGQLGEAAVAGIGIGGRFAGIYTVSLAAIVSAAGIFIAQFIGQNNKKSTAQSYQTSLRLALILALLFLLVCELFPRQIAGLYIQDPLVLDKAVRYLRIYAFSFLPMAVVQMDTVVMRCVDQASVPLVVTICSAVLNTLLNALLIFGALGFPAMKEAGAALASVLSITASWMMLRFFFHKEMKKRDWSMGAAPQMTGGQIRQYVQVAAPFFVTEFLWVLGENVYGSVYGHLGTQAFSAMTITNTVIGFVIGALSGFSSAASILTGKALGEGNHPLAMQTGRRLMAAGLVFALLLSAGCAGLSQWYASLFAFEWQTRQLVVQLLRIFAVYAPIKTLNMILGSGILRAGGKTWYTMFLDILGTWGFGVPFALLGWHLGWSVTAVYALLSFEEVIRLVLGLVLFHTGKWMKTLQEA